MGLIKQDNKVVFLFMGLLFNELERRIFIGFTAVPLGRFYQG